MDQIYAHAKLRFVIPAVLAGAIAPALIAVQYSAVSADTFELTLAQAVIGVATYLSILLFLWLGWGSGANFSDVFGASLDRAAQKKMLALGIPLFAISFFLIYLVFLPLSWVAPEFVLSWVVELPELLAPPGRPDAVRMNLVNIMLVAFVAPLVEEILFRGFVFGRLQHKYGTPAAILASSLLFAAFHPDVLGALVFAVVLCLIRLKYQSLVAPILVHVSNNVLVLVFIGVDLYVFDTVYTYTLDEFRAYAWWAIPGGLVGIPWLYRYYQADLRTVRWQRRTWD